MCGFLGYIGPENIDETAFRETLQLSRHRGPDSCGVHRRDTHLFGFNRLSIQDLSETGNQPMVSRDGQQVLLFNGEVYNHSRLRQKFAVSHCKGHGDTETLFHLFHQQDFTSIIPELDGMFAICWVDYSRGQAWLARDMAGIKPLYYHPGRPLVFGSQLNQLLHLPAGVNRGLSPRNITDYLALGYMLAPDTIFEGIRQVMPGEMVCLDIATGLVIQQRRYYIYQRDAGAGPDCEHALLKAHINASIIDQLVADVPVAAFMSGGVDSPVINAFAKHHKPDLRGYTFRNRYDVSLDESSVANALSRIIQLDYLNIDYTESDIRQAVDDHFRYMSEPCGDFSTIPTFFICRAARQGATVMLSGDGGDELFFGYNRHLAFFRDGWMFHAPRLLRKGFSAARKALGGPRASNTILYLSNPAEAYRETQMSIHPAALDRLLGCHDFSAACNEVFGIGNTSGDENLSSIVTRADYYGYLQMVLRKVDMMSMASSVEVRVPYLSRDIIDLSKTYLPTIQKETDLKRPLKQIFRSCYPGGESFRRKIGFTLPMRHLLRGLLKEDVVTTTCQMPFFGATFIDAQEVTAFVKGYFSHQHHSHQAVWHLYAWQKCALANQWVS